MVLKTYSEPLVDSTISNLSILRENIRFTNIDRENVMIPVRMKLVMDIDGTT